MELYWNNDFMIHDKSGKCSIKTSTIKEIVIFILDQENHIHKIKAFI